MTGRSMVASKRRVREAEKKSNRGNSGADYRARYAEPKCSDDGLPSSMEVDLQALVYGLTPERIASILHGVEQSKAGLSTPLDPVALLAELEALYPDV